MSRSTSTAAGLIALGALFLGATVATQAQDRAAEQNAAPVPETSTNPSAQTAQDDNRKPSSTNDQSGPSNAKPAADTNSQGEKSTHSVSGRSGKEEPGSNAPTMGAGEAPTPVFVNGALNVPGAPTDSQTVPAKFSARNDAIDKLPILGMSLGLSDAQKRTIVESVRAANAPAISTQAKVSEELPWDVTVQDLPTSANDPAMAKLKYVRAQDRVLLIEPSNRIVIGVIEN